MSKRDDWQTADHQLAGDMTQVKFDVGCRADNLKGVLHQIADQIADADRRHSLALQEMHQRLTKLGGQTETIKAAMPQHLASAFERIEDGIAQLAVSLAETDRERQVHAAADPATMPQENAAGTDPSEQRPLVAGEQSLTAQGAATAAITATTTEAPPPLKSAIGLEAPGGWGHKHLEPAMFEQNPDDPWDQNSAAALTKLYESGEAGLPVVNPGYEPAPVIAAPLNVASGAAPIPGDDTDQRAWLEARFSDIATRVERSLQELRPESSIAALGERFDHFEQRFTTALDGVATRSDVEGLRIVEAHIAELSEQIERTRSQLARLDAIEQQLAQLGHAFSDDELMRLLGGIVPTESDLVRFAEEAAGRVASRMSADPATAAGIDTAIVQKAAEAAEAAKSAQASTSRQMQSLHELLSTYMDERRRGEAQTADALETMQQAMQHMLDRVDAIEHQRTSLSPAYDPPAMPPVMSVDDERAASANLARTFAEEAKAAARQASQGSPAGRAAMRNETADRLEPRLETPIRPPAPRAAVSTEALAAQIAAVAPRGTPPEEAETEVDLASETNRPTGKPADRQAFIAMARRAAEQAKAESDRAAAATAGSSRSNPTEAAVVASASLKSRLLGATGGQGRTTSRTSMLLVASLGAVLLAGLWTVSGKKFNILRAAPVTEQSMPAKSQPAAGAPAIDTDAVPARRGTAAPQDGEDQPKRRSQPDTGSDDLGAAPKGTDRQSSLPGLPVQPAVQHVGMGIAIEQPPQQGAGEMVLRARQEQHMASLSQRTAFDAARTPVAADPTAAPARQDAPATIELPPAAVGPLSLRVAAGKGDASAQFDVAVRFAEGRGVKQDFEQAATWYQRAATQGLAQAQYRLAALYERGLGIAADPGRARIWYKRAAEQGNLKAMHNLAVMSAGGANADYATAIHWFREAAQRGLSDSQFNLGVMSESGLGMDQDLVAAYMWFSLAGRSGDKEATRRGDLLKVKLDTQQIAAGEAAVAAWRSRPVDRLANDPRAASEAWKQHAKAQ